MKKSHQSDVKILIHQWSFVCYFPQQKYRSYFCITKASESSADILHYFIRASDLFVYRTLLSVSNIIGLGTFSVWGGYCWTFSLEEDFFSSLEFGWKVRFFLLDFRELDFRELTKKCHKKAVPFGYENNGGQKSWTFLRQSWT